MNLVSSDLPAGLAEPLHLGEPWWAGTQIWWVIGTILLVIALIARFAGRLRRPPRVAAGPAPVEGASAQESPGPPAPGILDRIRDLRRRHLASTDYRSGCHRLSETLREHLEQAPSVAVESYTRLTTGEIRQRLGEVPWSLLLRDLAQLQFGRHAPTNRDWREICDRSMSLVERETAGGERP